MKTYVHIIALLVLFLTANTQAQAKDITITVHLRGVYESKISLLGLNNKQLFTAISEVAGVRNGETVVLVAPKEHLPGQFVIRFDYKQLESGTPYPSEKNIIINQQDLQLWVSPAYCNNTDSTYFQEGETENSKYKVFLKENSLKKQKMGVLQNFLLNYDETGSRLYRMGVDEYENRRKDFNGWLSDLMVRDKDLFVSCLYGFEYIPLIQWDGTEFERINSMIATYFEGMDFGNPDIIRSSSIKKWMDDYVNLYGQMATSAALRDSLFPLAGKTAIERARNGHPLVYGWMVDYFYRGYETSGIDAGMRILEPYLDDPNCKTSKRIEIEKRLKGIKILVPGSPVPPIMLDDTEGNRFDLYKMPSGAKYTLILFWSGGCGHCEELTRQLYPWQQQTEISEKLSVVAISLDETAQETAIWKMKKDECLNWKHLQAEGGVNSKVAGDFFVLATPVMVLVDQAARKIAGVPDTFQELKDMIDDE